MQQALKDKGFDPGAVDGVMGPKTVSALRDYQKSENVTMTGKLEPRTAATLGIAALPAIPFAATKADARSVVTSSASPRDSG